MSPVIGIADEDEDAIEREGNDRFSQKQHVRRSRLQLAFHPHPRHSIRIAVGRKDGIGIMVEYGVTSHNVVHRHFL